MKSIAIAVIATLAVAALLIGIWHLGWFVEERNVDRRAGINNQSYARQSALQEEVLDKYRTVTDIDVQLAQASEDDRAALAAQRAAVVDQFCDAYNQLTDSAVVSDRVQSFATQECS